MDRLNAALSDRYHIEREVGEGGMATVYLARDLRHDRMVALKVLKPELAAVMGSERFLTEIQTTARLQHPHILPLFDSGSADGQLFYVMPYVEGESLRERLDREKQLPVEEAVAIASKVAGALQAAHDQGIVHRDIKPANILLANGEPRVADFGIALAVQQAGGGRLTETGLSLGTPYYMSPEQATGDRDPDQRSDIYALACVLYEMLTGEPPFTGGTAQAVLGRILTGEPQSPTTIRRSIPVHVEDAILFGLEKLPADRPDSADRFREALAGQGASRQGASRNRGRSTAQSGPSRRTMALLLAVPVVALVAGWLVGRQQSSPDPGARDIGLPWNEPLSGIHVSRTFSVSADGRFAVYLARPDSVTRVYHLDVETGEVRPVAGTDGAQSRPVVSPDQRRVAFISGGQLRSAAIAGGDVATLVPAEGVMGIRWMPDGTLLYAENDGRRLRRLDPVRGPVRDQLTDYCLFPSLLEGERILCGGGADKYAYVITPERGYRESALLQHRDPEGEGMVRLRGSDFRVVDDDYLVYTSLDGTLMATRFLDREALEVAPPVPTVSGVRRQPYTGAGDYDLTADGALLYAPGPNMEVGPIVKALPDGTMETFRGAPAAHLRFSVSPDGRRMASAVDGLQEQELRIYDLRSGEYETVATATYVGHPLWSPDGRRLVFTEVDGPPWEERILVYEPNRTGAPRIVRRGANEGSNPSVFIGPDSVLVGVGAVSGMESYILELTGDSARTHRLGVQAIFISLSPDRRWLVYEQHGQSGAVLENWPDRDRRWSIMAGAMELQWTADTTLIAYSVTTSDAGPVLRARPIPGDDPPLSVPEVVIDDASRADTPGWSLDPTPDGGVAYLRAPARADVGYLRLVPGWVDEMKRRVDGSVQ
ncbi:MAG TPA: protein kinase [Longimicrobiales bacterium]|nr:protein kinase [Longimicrobiales bacterium]